MGRFINRHKELQRLRQVSEGLVVVYGRRRLGKTRLLVKWLSESSGIYSQALQASPAVQFDQLRRDLMSELDTTLEPTTWEQLFELIDRIEKPFKFCIDEFPYLVASDESVPSRFQRWLDHRKKTDITLVLSGSSTKMMHNSCLSADAPLYGRASAIICLGPMEYNDFLAAVQRNSSLSAFELYSLVGGVPKYWELVPAGASPEQAADILYFDYAPFMEEEPRRVLRDEQIEGLSPQALLEVVGRGASRPTEMAARLGVAQGTISKILQRLIDATILSRDRPFGSSARDSKKVVYRIADPSLRFWYSVFSPHRSRWRTYTREKRETLIHEHAATVFEDYCRVQFSNAARYWDRKVELDLLWLDGDELVVGEVKCKYVSKRSRTRILGDLQQRWKRCNLAGRYPKVRFEIFDTSMLD